jgi:ATP-dependent RNA helicase RhlE
MINNMTFDDLKLNDSLLRAIKDEGYALPTPVQARAIPIVLKGKDLICCAQTGTGKTAAFAIPMIQLMSQDPNKPGNRNRKISALVLTPTRELALQIGESFAAYGKNTSLKYTVVYGGVNQHAQVNALKSGVDVLIATPGRLLDLINQGFIHLSHVEYFVLDEADRMLDMGFVQDVRKVIARLPRQRQSLFFSATMPGAVAALADTILVNPAKVEVTPVSSTVNAIRQVVYYVDKKNKNALLRDILQGDTIDRALVFTRTKHGADKVARDLSRAGINSQAIHGNKSQNARQAALSNFKSNLTRVLVATDIAARGIDIEELSHVINFELPNIPESYVHRIGRTGRAGASGMAIAFCDSEEKAYLKDIQKLIGKNVSVVEDHPWPMMIHDVVKTTSSRGNSSGGRNNRRYSK